MYLPKTVTNVRSSGPSKSYQCLQDGEGWATDRHQFLITVLLVCEKWMRTSTRRSLGGCARLSLTWGFGVPCWCGVGGPCPGVSALLIAGQVSALGKYLDPAGDRDRYGPQNPAYVGTKISGYRPRGLAAQGVTSDLATCSPVQDVLAQGILDKSYH